MKILVLEDDLMIQEGWRDMLEDLVGCDAFLVAGCPDDARLAMSAGFEPTIIFSDWEMPGQTGGEFCAELRAAGDTTPVVIVSGVSRMHLLAASGATAFLGKPFDREAVVAALERWTAYRTPCIGAE